VEDQNSGKVVGTLKQARKLAVSNTSIDGSKGINQKKDHSMSTLCYFLKHLLQTTVKERYLLEKRSDSVAFFMNPAAGRKHKLTLRLPALQRGKLCIVPVLL